MGPAGLAFAQAILQSGPEAIKLMNQQFNEIQALSQETTKKLTNQFFGERIQDLKQEIGKTNDWLREIAHILDTGKMPHAQAGGTVASTGAAVIHKGEMIVPAGGSSAGFTGDITLELDGEVLARITRNQLLKLKARNATTGL
jgi:hypothetical protein